MSFLAYLLWQTKVMAGDHVYSAYLARFWRPKDGGLGLVISKHLCCPVTRLTCPRQ